MLHFNPLTVTAVRPDSEHAVAIELRVPESLIGEYTALPGQHIAVRMNVDGEPLRRTYSLWGPQDGHTLRIAARVHDRGAVSTQLASLEPGDTLDCMPPNGSFTVPVDPAAARVYVAFAAGCGITPVAGLIAGLMAREPRSRFILVYGNRTRARTMLLEELQALKDRYVDRVSLHFIMSAEEQEIDLYNGRIDAARIRAMAGSVFAPAATDAFFLCGPGDMIDTVRTALASLGVSPGVIHSEHFTTGSVADTRSADTPSADAAPVQGDEPAPATTEGREVRVVMDGRELTYPVSGDATLLEAGLDAGLDLPYSCCAGVCSTCRVLIVSGEVQMLDNYALEDWEVERGYVLACQATPVSPRVVLTYDER